MPRQPRRKQKEQPNPFEQLVPVLQTALQNLTWPKLAALVLAVVVGLWQYAGIKDGIASNTRRLTTLDQRVDEIEDVERKLDSITRETNTLDDSLNRIRHALNRTIEDTVHDALKDICRSEDPQSRSPLCEQLRN